MIVADTNIISELMKTSPDPHVIAWLDTQEPTFLFITTISIAEITYGIQMLAEGNRRRLLDDAFCTALETAFKHRILSFDDEAAHRYGKLMSQRKSLGRPLSILDGQIAAIAQTHGFSLATRNVRDFEHCHISLVNPFEYTLRI